MEDRLWRHPSEIAAEERVGTAEPSSVSTVATLRTSWKQGIALASIGALGGALVVTGLFLTVGGPNSELEVQGTEPVTTTLAFDPVVPVNKQVDADQWPGEVVSPTSAGVARVIATTESGTRTGSGVVYQSDGLILTSYDLVSGAESITVNLPDGTGHLAVVKGVDAISGLAVVHIAHMDLPTAPLGVFKPAHVGDSAVTLAGLAPVSSLKQVRLSSKAVSVPIDSTTNLHGLMQLDGGMPDGATGGAIVDDSGAVIGIVVDVGTTNATYAVPIAYARVIAHDLVRYGHKKHAWLGIKGVDLDGDAATDLDIDGAVRVSSIIDRSPANDARLRKGDVVVTLDGQPVLSMTELILELRNHPPDDDVIVGLMRDGKALQLEVILGTRPVGDTT
jgi:serine protease DegQ